MRLLLFFLFSLLGNIVYTQEKIVTIKGEIFDTQNVGIVNCTIKISSKSTGQIFKYLNTNGDNFFFEKIKIGKSDTLLINVSHTSYETFQKTIYTREEGINIQFVLKLKTNQLQQVNIEAPKKWVRGDTTFYKVDAYKEGDEKKLKDILLKMPDFRLDEKGKVLYKNKTLDKVTIDNEEMFADKVELLLNNFPVHVLNNIQAIDNQSNQKLLKGLDGANNTFLNLDLKKEAKISTAFGDTELGIDNLGRYNFAPVIFSMYGKLKVGFIGNYNKIGNGVSHELETELKNNYENEATKFLMNTNSLSLINNFHNRWYVQNKQWDNRLQLNSKLNKNIKSQFQFAYVNDRQTQNTFNNSLLYTNSNYVQRIDTSSNSYRPQLFSIKENLTFNIGSTSELIINASAYFDRSIGNKKSIYKGLDITSPLGLETNNHWNSFSLSNSYITRTSENRASSLYLNINRNDLTQNGLVNSLDLSTLLNLGTLYNTLNVQANANITNIGLGWSEKLKTKKGYLLNFGINATYQKLNLDNLQQAIVKDENVLQPISKVQSQYSSYTIAANFNKSIKWFLKNPISFNSSLGIGNIQTKENNNTYLFMNASTSYKHNLVKNIKAEMKLFYKDQPIELDNVYNFYYPTSLTSFSKNNLPNFRNNSLNFNYSLIFSLLNDLNTVYIATNYSNNFNSQIQVNDYSGFFQYSNILTSKIDTRNLSISSKISHPALWINAMLDFNYTYTAGNKLLFFNKEILLANFNFSVAGISLRKNWNKKIYLKINPSLLRQVSKTPTFANKNVVATFRTDLYQRYVFNQQFSIISNAKLQIQNLSKPNQASLLLIDAEFNYKLKTKPIFFSIKADNLSNQKNYYFYYNSEQLLNYGTIPLIGRNVYVSAKYDF